MRKINIELALPGDLVAWASTSLIYVVLRSDAGSRTVRLAVLSTKSGGAADKLIGYQGTQLVLVSR